MARVFVHVDDYGDGKPVAGPFATYAEADEVLGPYEDRIEVHAIDSADLPARLT